MVLPTLAIEPDDVPCATGRRRKPGSVSVEAGLVLSFLVDGYTTVLEMVLVSPLEERVTLSALRELYREGLIALR